MSNISISNDIVPIGEFKVRISKWLKSIKNSKHHLVITQNGKPAGVLMSPPEYDELVYQKAFRDSVDSGLRDADSGKVISTDELKVELTKARKQR